MCHGGLLIPDMLQAVVEHDEIKLAVYLLEPAFMNPDAVGIKNGALDIGINSGQVPKSLFVKT